MDIMPLLSSEDSHAQQTTEPFAQVNISNTTYGNQEV